MQSKKQKKDLKVAILVPCYKRPEYTDKCLEVLFKAQEYTNCEFFLIDDCSNDQTNMVIDGYKGKYYGNRKINVIKHEINKGLRQTIIDFFKYTGGKFDILSKVDSDCLVPKGWLNHMLYLFQTTPADILSPAVFPSEAELKYGKHDKNDYGYLPTKTIGGLWNMKASMVEGLEFEEHDLGMIKGAIPLLWQIVSEKEPNIGWVQDVVFQDMGHWSGKHPDNIKTQEHEDYYREVDRRIAWRSQKEVICQ